MIDQDVWQEETAYLRGVSEALQTELGEIDGRFERGVAAADDAGEESVRRMLESRYRALGRAGASPYFARIDFTEQTKPEPQKLYIGKTSVYGGGASPLVTDWRAPVSSLYYDGRLGPASYDSPGGSVCGSLSLKRRLTVEEGELRGVDDIDVTASDELLAPYLSVSADARLKEIIATIQTEQNQIIRADARRPLIVQGAAGSGKTTVALHRIAYLAYNAGARFRPEQFIVLTSGGFFLSYIAGILPDLGVEDVPQLSFEELVRRYVRYGRGSRRQSDLGGGGQARDPLHGDGYKHSYEILSDIDAFLAAETEPKRSGAAQLYRRFLEQAGYTNGAPQGTSGLDSGRQNRHPFSEDDLAPLLYLRIRASGLNEAAVRHVVIDEAQDFSAMQITVLQTLFRKASFTILGDLAQRIGARGVNDWDGVNRQVWQGAATVLRLQKSYRVTVEIMEAANKVLGKLPGLPKGEAVVRHGEPVGYADVWGEVDRAAVCAERIERRRSQGHRNIAVLLSGAERCKGFAHLLKGVAGLSVVTSRDGTYEGGVCLLPAALSKGLEFDSVIVADADRYGLGPPRTPGPEDGSNPARTPPAEEMGIKLLYVAMTRAMHTLDILYEGEPPF
ncbi:MAG: hypothetical protein LBH95_09440 [Oscillospiraceae bacterium]|nr:hypothetical protein [Oscillospiraceae bacterium]